MKAYKNLSKKLLSCLLALVMLVSSVTVTLSVFADDTSAQADGVYTVTYESPAIPIYVGKMINLSDIEVEFAKGEAPVVGSAITWKSGEEEVKSITANEAGVTELVATVAADTTKTKTVYVVAAEEGEDFYLVDLDFEKDSNAFVASDWLVTRGTYKSGYDGVTGNASKQNFTNAHFPALNYYALDTGDSAFSKVITYADGKVTLSTIKGDNRRPLQFLYKNDILMDFSDYTLEAKVEHLNPMGRADYKYARYENIGFVTRANYATNPTYYTAETFSGIAEDTEDNGVYGTAEDTLESLNIMFHKDSGVSIFATHNNRNAVSGSSSTTSTSGDGDALHTLNSVTATNGDGTNIFTTSGDHLKTVTAGEGIADYTLGSDKIKTLTTVLKGEDIVYSVDGKVVLDTDAATIWQTKNTKDGGTAVYGETEGKSATYYSSQFSDYGTTEKGTVGFSIVDKSDNYNTYKALNVYSLKVKLNSDATTTLPKMSDITIVDPAAPAVGMYVNTKVNLSGLSIQLSDDITMLGADVTWSKGDIYDENNGFLDDSAKTFAAFKTGVYQLKATSGDNSANVYFIVNDAGNTDFYLVDLDLTNEANFNAEDWLVVAGTDASKKDGAASSNNSTPGYTNDGIRYRMYYYLLDTVNDTDFAGILGYDTAEGAMSITKKSGYLSRRPIQVLYDNAMLKDFSDYTVSADVQYDRDSVNTSAATRVAGVFNRFQSFGLITRADYVVTSTTEKYTATELAALGTTTDSVYTPPTDTGIYSASNTALVTGVHAYSALTMYSPSKENISGYASGTLNGVFTLADSTAFDYNSQADEFTVSNATAVEEYSLGYDNKKTFTIALDGSDLTYSLATNGGEAKTIFDSTDTDNIKKITYPWLASDQRGLVTSSADTGYSDRFDANGTTAAGTVGFSMADLEGMLIYNLKVKANNPVVLEGTEAEKPDVPTQLYMPVNHIFNPADIEELNGFTLAANSTDAAYIKEGNAIIATSTGKITFKKDLQEAIINVSEDSTSNDIDCTKIADNVFTISKNGDGQYVFTVDNADNIVPGSFKATAAGGSAALDYSVDSNGTTVDFTLDSKSTLLSYLSVEAEFVKELDKNYVIGQQINGENGLRFLNAVTDITSTESTKELDADNYKAVGIVIIPEVLRNNVEIKYENLPNILSEITFDEGGLPKQGTYQVTLSDGTNTAASKAQLIIFSKYQSTHGYYTQFAATLLQIPDNFKDTDITAAFFGLRTDNSATAPVVATTSYNAVYNRVYSYLTVTEDSGSYDLASLDTEELKPWFIGGTDHDLDNDASTSSISYDIGEEIVFIHVFQSKGTTRVDIKKDDPTTNCYGDYETVPQSGNIVYTDYIDHNVGDVWTYTTKMAGPGTVACDMFACEPGTTTRIIRTKGGSYYIRACTTALVDVENITQPITVDLTNENLTDDAKNINTAYGAMKTAFQAKADTVIAALENDKENLVSFLTTAAVGGTYSISNIVELKCLNVNTTTNVRNFSFVFATNEEVGTKTNTNNGLFEYFDSTLRPSTGVIGVNAAALSGTDAINVTVNSQGYGCEASVSKFGTDGIRVNMNTHGANAVDAAGFTALNKKPISEGGTQNFIKTETATEFANYTSTYQYGIIMRDYVALQVAEYIANINVSGRTVNTTVDGDSMGGWQSVMLAALDDTVDKATLRITWMCSVGAEEVGDITGWYQTKNYNKWLFNSVNAAQYASLNNSNLKEVTITAGLSDWTSPPAGVMALYNAYTGTGVTKTITFAQWNVHSAKISDNSVLSSITNAQ